MFFLRKSSPFLLMIAVAAAAWRLHLTGRILEYDEIWTLENFARWDIAEIFSDFITPNNHPFNTLWVKFSHAWSINHWDMRLASVVFTCGAMIFGALSARRIYGKCAAVYTMAAMAFLPPFLAAGSTARGYAGQLFLLTIFVYALLRCRKGAFFWTLTAAVSAAAAAAALPSSILFLAPAGGFFLGTMLEKRRLCRVHLYMFGAAVVFACWWYSRNWNAFLETQKFAIPLHNVEAILNWLKEICSGTAMLLPVMLLTVFLKRRRVMTWGIVLAIAFPLLAACISGAAPARVYLPCAAAAALLCAPAVKRFRKSWFIIALAGQFFISLPIYPGTAALESAVMTIPAGSIPLFTPTDSYIIKYNYPGLCREIPREIHRIGNRQQITLALIKSPGKISGIDSQYRTVTWKLSPAPAEHNGITLLKLHRNHNLNAGKPAFIILPPMPKREMERIFSLIPQVEIMVINGWMNVPLTTADGKKLFYMLLAVKSASALSLPEKIPLYTFSD